MFEQGHRKVGGRRLGTPNKVTLEAMEAAAEIVDDPIYRRNLLKRARAGDLPPALEMMLWAYAKGKPHQLEDLALPAPPVSLTQVNVTQFNLDRLTTEQLDQLDRLLELAGLEGAPNAGVPPMLEAAPK